MSALLKTSAIYTYRDCSIKRGATTHQSDQGDCCGILESVVERGCAAGDTGHTGLQLQHNLTRGKYPPIKSRHEVDLLEPVVERVCAAEDIGQEEVQESPQLVEVVLTARERRKKKIEIRKTKVNKKRETNGRWQNDKKKHLPGTYVRDTSG